MRDTEAKMADRAKAGAGSTLGATVGAVLISLLLLLLFGLVSHAHF